MKQTACGIKIRKRENSRNIFHTNVMFLNFRTQETLLEFI